MNGSSELRLRLVTLAFSLTAAILMIALLARILPESIASVVLDINRASWPFTVQNALWLAFFAGLGEVFLRCQCKWSVPEDSSPAVFEWASDALPGK